MIIKFGKFEKKLECYQKLLKLESLKIDNDSIKSKNYATAYHPNLEEVPRTLLAEKKLKKLKKIQKT